MIQIFLFIIALLGQYAQCNSAEVIVYTIENKLESDFSCQCDLKITPSEGWKLAMPPDVDYSNSSDPATMSVETVSFDNHSCHLRVNSSRASASDYRRFSLKVTCSACSDMCRIIPLNIDVEFGSKYKTFIIFLILAFVGGCLLNFMPCVLPVILLKLSAFKSKVALIGTIVGNYIAFFIFAIFLIGMKLTGQTIGWGMHFQDIRFLVMIAILLLLLLLDSLNAISLMPSITLKSMPRSPFVQHMMSGFIAAVLAIPCTAPVLGMVATFAIQGRIDELLLIFISIATGFSLPYIIGIFWVPRIPSNIGKISEYVHKVATFGLACTFVWVCYLIMNNLTQPIQKTSFSQTLSEINQSVEQGGTVMLNISAPWCVTCKYNKVQTLNSKVVTDAMKQYNVHYIEVDLTKNDPQVLDYMKKYGRVGIPFTIVYGPRSTNGVVLSEIPNSKEVVSAIRVASGANRKRNGD